MKLTAEKIQSNWEDYRNRVNTLFPDRRDALNSMYDEFEDRLLMMPASGTEYYHNAIPGGYVDHILRVMDCATTLYSAWKTMGSNCDGYTVEELMFAAMHHDLGKVGFPGEGNELYLPNESEWHRKNQGKLYNHNPNIPHSSVPDLSLWLLQQYAIQTSWNEYQAIKIHDGMYDDANKTYFMGRNESGKLRTNLPILLHHADHMASVIEYERWKGSHTSTAPSTKINTSYGNKARMQKLGTIVNESVPVTDTKKMFEDLFGE